MADHQELLREAVLVSRDLRRAQDDVSRLSAERRDLVQKLRDCGVSHGAIAAHLGVTRSAVQQLLRREGSAATSRRPRRTRDDAADAIPRKCNAKWDKPR